MENIARKRVDVVLPAYNPHINWEKGVAENFLQLQELLPQYDFSLYIATDGSEMGFEPETVGYLKRKIPGVTIVSYDVNRGKGFALRSAVRLCTGDYTMNIDHDFPYTFQSIANVLKSLDDGADVVIATRSESYQQNLPIMRRVLSRASHLVNKMLFRLPFVDTQGGLKGFNRHGREIFLTTNIERFLYDTQFIYRAVHAKADVRSVNAEIKKGLKVSSMGLKVLLREIKNIPEVVR